MRANFVDGGATPVTHYDEVGGPQTKGYETAVGQGPTEDLRPPIETTPPANLKPDVGHNAKNA